MFQYAAGRACALSNDCDLLLDLRRFDRYSLHQGFELQKIFSTNINTASIHDINNVLGWRSNPSIINLLSRWRIPLLRYHGLVAEPQFNYWSGLQGIGINSYIKGYWQSEKYFKNHERVIRADFEFKLPLSKANCHIANRIRGSNSVGLHIRRGDYISEKENSAIFSICGLGYYNRAIEYLAGKVDSPHYFIFSNDISWAKENLKLNYPVEYVEENYGESSYVDMQLMSYCQHNIIANSTFSWWAAWLNSYVNKIVIAPRNWFCNGLNDDDLIPDGWIRL